MQLRRRYQQLELKHHRTMWSTEEDMLAFVADVGALARLVMAAEDRWVHDGNVQMELGGKLAECQWWLLVLSDRLGINMSREYPSFIDRLAVELGD